MGTTFTNTTASSAQSETLSGRIVSEIRDAVFDDRLRPGDVVGSEQELAARFGVSRITVRDALRTLSAMGLVTIRQGARGGARVSEPNLDHFADALAVQFQLARVDGDEVVGAQTAVEGMAAELAALHHTKKDLRRLRDTLEHASELTHDAKGFTEASLGFHVAVVEASNNRALVSMLRALRHVVWTNDGRRLTPEVIARIQRAHRLIFERIEAKDGVGARDAMNTHLGGIRKRIKNKQRERVC